MSKKIDIQYNYGQITFGMDRSVNYPYQASPTKQLSQPWDSEELIVLQNSAGFQPFHSLFHQGVPFLLSHLQRFKAIYVSAKWR